MVQLSEKIETIQKKHNADLGLNFMCIFEFGYTEFSFRQASLSVRLKKSPCFILSSSFMGKLNKCLPFRTLLIKCLQKDSPASERGTSPFSECALGQVSQFPVWD